ncbi:MAG TPA: hypothetical protein VL403_14885 [Candidatus Kryptonia bacterium]|nr:hypothetical protein [Candidatus Kryptonia bacterium]
MSHSALYAYSRTRRIVAAVLTASSRLSLPVIGLAVGFVIGGSVPLLALVRIVTVFAVLPAAAAWMIARASTVTAEIRDGIFTLSRTGLRIEVPCAAIVRIAPWRLPLPQPGFSLEMRSGRRLGYGLAGVDPAEHVSVLAGALADDAARAAMRHPMVRYAHAKRTASRRWYQLTAKFGAFSLLPTAIWFNAHQHIAYGGLLGQYYLEGFRPYAKTWLISWALTSIYLVLYASVWRGLAETLAWSAAWMAPTRITGMRRVVEIVCGVAYYVGVPILVVLPFVR